MKRLARLIGIVLVGVGAVQGAAAQPATRPAPIDVTKLGPQVGQRIPDFSLKDQAGRTWTRQSTLGPQGAMIVFFRSADW